MSIFIDSFLENGSTSCRFVLLFPRSVPKFVIFQTRILENDELKSTKVHRFGGPMSKCSFRTSSPNSFKSLHLKKNWLFQQKSIYLGLSPFPVIVTSRIITFLVRDSELNLHLPKGPHPTYITLLSISFRLSWHKFHQNSPPPAGTLHAHHHPQRHAGPEKSVKPTAFFSSDWHCSGFFVSKKYPLDRLELLKWLVPRLVRTLDKTKDLAFWCPLQKNLSTSQGNFLWSFLLFLLKPKIEICAT